MPGSEAEKKSLLFRVGFWGWLLGQPHTYKPSYGLTNGPCWTCALTGPEHLPVWKRAARANAEGGE